MFVSISFDLDIFFKIYLSTTIKPDVVRILPEFILILRTCELKMLFLLSRPSKENYQTRRYRVGNDAAGVGSQLFYHQYRGSTNEQNKSPGLSIYF